LGLAFDDAGEPMIAHMGGMMGMYRCGGSDIVLARRSGGSTWNVTTVDDDGHNTPYFPEDATDCAQNQDECNKGDAVGPWPAVEFAQGQPLVLYRDIHFAFAQVDSQKADLELSWTSRITLDATHGGGTFTRVALDSM